MFYTCTNLFLSRVAFHEPQTRFSLVLKRYQLYLFCNAFLLKWEFYIKKQKLRKSQNIRTWYIQCNYTFLHKAWWKRIMLTLLLSDGVCSNLKTWTNTREINVIETTGVGTVISVNLEATRSAWWVTNYCDLYRIYFINLSTSQSISFFHTSDINISNEWAINRAQANIFLGWC